MYCSPRLDNLSFLARISTLLLLSAVITFSLNLAVKGELISTEQEIAIGRKASRRFEQKYGVVTDLRYVERINRIGSKLAQQGTRRLHYRFRVAALDDFNALAFPGGFIYATRGLMDSLPDEELAFVLGHEVAHVEKRHSINQLEQQLYTQIGLFTLAGVLTRGRLTQDEAALIRLANLVITNQYSQADEAEADRIGILLMAKAGYDPAFSVTALKILAQKAGKGTPGFLNTIIGTHPLPQDRISSAISQVPTVEYHPATLLSSSDNRKPTLRLPPTTPNRPRIDRKWESLLTSAIRKADTGVSVSHHLTKLAHRLLRSSSNKRKRYPTGRNILVKTFWMPPQSTVSQAETTLIGKILSQIVINKRFSQYGLSVGLWPDGKHRVILVLR